MPNHVPQCERCKKPNFNHSPMRYVEWRLTKTDARGLKQPMRCLGYALCPGCVDDLRREFTEFRHHFMHPAAKAENSTAAAPSAADNQA